MKEEPTCDPETHDEFVSPERVAEIRARSRELFPDFEPLDVDRALASATPQELELKQFLLKWIGIEVIPLLLQEVDRELRQNYTKVLLD